MECGACGAANLPASKFCGECGARLSVGKGREERKIVTVLFADLVGFTSRSEKLDVEEVRGTLAPYHASLRDTLEQFGGTVEKFIGDAVMAVFGAPIAHEDDAERAVRAALAIRDGLGQVGDDLHVRMGVNTGEALVSIGADPRLGEGMVSGDMVNTAARLQAAAPVDGVLVGETTFRAAERPIRFEPHDSIDVKGKTRPVRCWLAIDARAMAPDAPLPVLPLVGREREHHLLSETFERCRAERMVQLVTVVGVPGIGKSRLVAELRAQIEAEPALTRWRQGHVLSYGEGISFFALSELVKQECGILDSDDARTASRKLDEAIAALRLEGVDALWVRAQIASLVSIDATSEGMGQAEAFAGWRMFIESMADEGPTVIVIEDMHWADDALLEFVDGLIERVRDVPLLVVCTSRPELLEQRPGWGGGKTNALTIGLGPLSPDDTTALVGTLIDRSILPVDAESELVERSGGNPLYAQEYVRMVVEHGADAAAMPETVQGIIAARLDGLSEAEKNVLQDAAVMGVTSWIGALSAIREKPVEETDAALTRLERKQLIRRERRSTLAGELEVSFTHALIRDVAYGQLTRTDRAERHERAARWIDGLTSDRAGTAALVAHHYTSALALRAALGTDDEQLRVSTFTALVAACREAAARHDHSGVVAHADAALALDVAFDATMRAELLTRRAVARSESGHPDEQNLLEARDAAIAVGRDEDAIRLLCLLSDWAQYFAADLARSDEYNRQALALADALPPGPVTTLPAYTAAYRLWVTGRYAETVAFADAQLERAYAAGARSAAGLLLEWRGIARVELGEADGLDDLREAARLLEEQAHPKAAVALINLAGTLHSLGRKGEVRDAWEAARSSARRIGNEDQHRTASILAVHEKVDSGDITDASDTLDQAAIGANAWHAHLIADVRSRVVLDSDPEQSARFARQAAVYARQIEHHGGILVAEARVACAEQILGNDQAANEALDEFLTRWHEMGSSLDAIQGLVDVALVLAAYSRHAEIAPAVDLVLLETPWREAARAIGEQRYADAAQILDSIPSVPLAAAARRLEENRR